MSDPTLLLAVDDDAVRDVTSRFAADAGFETVEASDHIPDFLVQVASEGHRAVVMDLNYGLLKPVRQEAGIGMVNQSITPARNAYALIKHRTKSGEAYFLGMSGAETVVEIAREEGIPAISKPIDIPFFMNWLQAARDGTPLPEFPALENGYSNGDQQLIGEVRQEQPGQ